MNARKKALVKIAERNETYQDITTPYKVDENYGSDSFGIKTLEDYLSKPIYRRLLETIKKGVPLDEPPITRTGSCRSQVRARKNTIRFWTLLPTVRQ